MWSKSKSVLLSCVLVKVLFAILVAGAFIIPKLAYWYTNQLRGDSFFIPLTIALYILLAFAFVAVYCLDRLLTNIKKENVFISKNVAFLRTISWCCFGVSIVFAMLGFYRYLAFFLCFATAFLGIILRVVKNVIEQAVFIREENEYTI